MPRRQVIGHQLGDLLLRVERREGVVGAAEVLAAEPAQLFERAHLAAEADVDVIDAGIVFARHEEQLAAALGEAAHGGGLLLVSSENDPGVYYVDVRFGREMR